MNNYGAADRELSIIERFAAGSFAGGFSQSAIYPMEVRGGCVRWAGGVYWGIICLCGGGNGATVSLSLIL